MGAIFIDHACKAVNHLQRGPPWEFSRVPMKLMTMSCWRWVDADDSDDASNHDVADDETDGETGKSNVDNDGDYDNDENDNQVESWRR